MSTIELIMKLLAKAERTEFEAEAATYLAKAQELQTRHAIDAGLIAQRMAAGTETEAEPIVSRYYCQERNTKMIKAKRDLAVGLGQMNNCFAVMGPSRSYIMLTGHVSDVAMVDALFDSVMVQLFAAMTRAENESYPAGMKIPMAWRVSYAHAYVNRVLVRMRQAKRDVVNETAGPGNALVLVDRSKKAEMAYKDRHGDTKKGAKTRYSDTSEAGRRAGYRDANNASLGQRGVSDTSNARSITP